MAVVEFAHISFGIRLIVSFRQ